MAAVVQEAEALARVVGSQAQHKAIQVVMVSFQLMVQVVAVVVQVQLVVMQQV